MDPLLYKTFALRPLLHAPVRDRRLRATPDRAKGSLVMESGASLAGEPEVGEGFGEPLGDPRLPRPIKPPAYHTPITQEPTRVSGFLALA